MTRGLRSGATALVLLLAVAGCTPEGPGGSRAGGATPAPTEVRHDLEPLTTRFLALADPVSATWVTWNSAVGGMPGPTTYWMHAVVTLAPVAAEALRSRYAPTETGRPPDVDGLLRADVPAGPLLTGPALDQALSTSGWQASAFLARQGHVLVLLATDD